MNRPWGLVERGDGSWGPPPPPPVNATPFRWMAPEAMPRRRWIFGRHYVRKFVTTTTAAPGVGKSSLTLAEAIAIATGRDFLGVAPEEQTNVWCWGGEDPLEELQRRVIATALHYGIAPGELEGRMFLDSGRDSEIIIGQQTRTGCEINAPVVGDIMRTIRENGIGVMIVDPFVSSHRVTENDNNAIDLVAKTWAKIADRTGCAIELVHHARKTGGGEVGVEDTRGAGALLGAARSARVINPMTEEEAAKVEVENRRLYFRVENGKASLSAPSEKATWFRLVSVDLGNGEPGQPGDSVGVVEPWRWPDAFEGITTDDLRAAQKAVAAGGPWRENNQAKDWVGIPIARTLGLDPTNKAHKRKVASLLKAWTAAGMFVAVTGRDTKRMERSYVEVGEWA